MIVGFRYFFFEPSSSKCWLFATFVDFSYRRQGVASRLIKESFEIASFCGCSEFEVGLTFPKTPEKNALFDWYCRYGQENAHRFKLKVYYVDRIWSC